MSLQVEKPTPGAWGAVFFDRVCGQMFHSLNSLKGGYIGDYIWDYYRGY